jgi:hypothetical protein
VLSSVIATQFPNAKEVKAVRKQTDTAAGVDVSSGADAPAFNATAFYGSVRDSLFGGSLSQAQVDGHGILGRACGLMKLDPMIEHSAYVLATAYHETAQTMQPIEEWGGPSTSYAPWYGRGFVQLTWEDNYKHQQDKLGAQADLLTQYGVKWQVHDDWNLALEPATSALITVGGMRDGDFTGKGLPDYITSSSVDYVNARRIVNGTDKAETIAGYAEKYETALRAGLGE